MSFFGYPWWSRCYVQKLCKDLREWTQQNFDQFGRIQAPDRKEVGEGANREVLCFILGLSRSRRLKKRNGNLSRSTLRWANSRVERTCLKSLNWISVTSTLTPDVLVHSCVLFFDYGIYSMWLGRGPSAVAGELR